MIKKKYCTGCSACYHICPKKAIIMEEEKDGFCYPVIDKEKCINCGLCEKVCPVFKEERIQSSLKCFAAYSKDIKERMDSSSGGIFSLLAKAILDQGGVVVGAVMENLKLRHIIIEEKEDICKLRGSKYIQSDLTNLFFEINKKLKENIKVLFVGTPCQVAGLKSYLQKDYDYLFCVDVICHGVPSKKLFQKYIEELENTYSDTVKQINFRDKKEGWESYHITVSMNHHEYYKLHNDDIFMKLFLLDVSLRESCYNCHFKESRYSDITLGDFWGIFNVYPKMNDKKGTSAIVIWTEKGKLLWNLICKNVVFKETFLEKIIDGNPSLIRSATLTRNRKILFKKVDKMSLDHIYHKVYPKERRLFRKK